MKPAAAGEPSAQQRALVMQAYELGLIAPVNKNVLPPAYFGRPITAGPAGWDTNGLADFRGNQARILGGPLFHGVFAAAQKALARYNRGA